MALVATRIALTGLSVLICASTGAMPTPRNGELLYIRPLGGNASHDGRLFVMRPDGSAMRDVTPAGIVNVDQALVVSRRQSNRGRRNGGRYR